MIENNNETNNIENTESTSLDGNINNNTINNNPINPGINVINNMENTNPISTEVNLTNLEQTKIDSLKKHEKKKFWYKIFISIFVLFILLIGFFVIFKNFKNANKITFEEDYELYQYFSGIKTSYNGKVTLSLEGDITKIKSNNDVKDIEDAPIYFGKEDNVLLTPQNMQLVFPRYKNKAYKLKYFTKVYYDFDNKTAYYLKNKKDKIYLTDSFLYNGDNLYIILDEISFKIDDKEYNLSPLSYIIVNYKGQIEMYNKANDKYTTIESHKKDVVIMIDNYNVNLSTDMVFNKDESILLVKNVSNLKEYNNQK